MKKYRPKAMTKEQLLNLIEEIRLKYKPDSFTIQAKEGVPLELSSDCEGFTKEAVDIVFYPPQIEIVLGWQITKRKK